jgi:hypothetical protein
VGLRLGLGVRDLEVDRSVTALLNSRAISRRNLQRNRTNEEMDLDGIWWKGHTYFKHVV